MTEHSAEQSGAESRRPTRPGLVCLLVLAVLLVVQIPGVLLVRKYTFTRWSVDLVYYYGPAAESILAGQGPRMSDGSLLRHYPPGFSYYFAALMGAGRGTGTPVIAWVVTANLAWNVLTVAGLFWIGYRLGGTRLAVFGALVAGLYPSMTYMAKIAFVQVPYLSFLVWGVYCAMRGQQDRRLGWFVVSGLLLGVAGLLRPAALPMLAALAGYLLIFFRGGLVRRVLRPTLAVAGFCLAIAPWFFYAYAVEGRPGLLGDVAVGHLEGRLVYEYSRDSGGVQGIKHVGALLNDPLGHSAEIGRRAIKSWYHTDRNQNEHLVAIMNAPFALLLLIGTLKMFKSRWRWGGGLLLWMFLGCWGLSTLTVFLARYVATGLIVAGPLLGAGAMVLWDGLGRLLPGRRGSAKADGEARGA